ncbi:G-type lectin S-receptor-like serine/threonine-protein kinase At4g27290 [Arachis hypogaea]|uniref:G-type lectin S-receptor-like serine/threonine-protein kinase At4g27290 n=2 Tax=Arachis TaxID=3817 RepID=UPI000DECFA22
MKINPSFWTIIAYTLVIATPFFHHESNAMNTSIITPNQCLGDGKTIVSKDKGTFELGFFTKSNKRYLGIWYANITIQTIVWVANGADPINDYSPVTPPILELKSTGSLVLTHKNVLVWQTMSSSPATAVRNPVAELLDSGNLVIREENDTNPQRYLWQSFDYPSNTMLAGMKLGWDIRRNFNRKITAWKSDDNPEPGDFSWSVMRYSYPEVYMTKRTRKMYRIGPWNGLRFSGMPELRSNPIFNFNFVSTAEEVYYTWTLKDPSLTTIAVLNQSAGGRPRYVWSEADKSWRTYSTLPGDYCDTYGLCGPNGYCSITSSPVCECLKGFKPKFPKKWNSMDWSQGCERNHPIRCNSNGTNEDGDGFVLLQRLKVPDTEYTLVYKDIDLNKCRAICLENCSCMAYTNSDIRAGGQGCVMWFHDLIDIKLFPDGGQDLYVRLRASELGADEHRQKRMKIIVGTTIAAAIISVTTYSAYRFRKKIAEKSSKIEDNYESYVDDLDLPLLNYSAIMVASNNFSVKNKIGEGGFGPVYLGKLANEQEVAIKRLSKSSIQGFSEFINEVKLIAKLQHRNLVKLIGCCIQGQEKMLVYEYMTNGSLDYFIFDHSKGKLLNWQKRNHIIGGIARGLMYLHQDSRLRIVHRDLKASNILLDDNLSSKISDFGMARPFRGEQNEESTNKIVGTFGYMAPEYLLDGLFSVKSDVYSFGVLLLEIISGKKNRRSHAKQSSLNLIDHTWALWKMGNAFQIIDPNIEDSCIESEVLRFIHIALLCVQHCPEDRPNMTSVVLMLSSEMELDQPKEPGFFTRRENVEANSCTSYPSSNNEISITLLTGR